MSGTQMIERLIKNLNEINSANILRRSLLKLEQYQYALETNSEVRMYDRQIFIFCDISFKSYAKEISLHIDNHNNIINIKAHENIDDYLTALKTNQAIIAETFNRVLKKPNLVLKTEFSLSIISDLLIKKLNEINHEASVIGSHTHLLDQFENLNCCSTCSAGHVEL